MNTLLGQKVAAVSPRPQTTRKQQLGILTLDDAQIIFTDTPGIHKVKHKLGGYMNEEATLALEESDLIMFVVDASEQPTEEDLMIAGLVNKLRSTPVLLLVNKIDLVGKEQQENRAAAFQDLVPAADLVMVSALDGANIAGLVDKITSLLPENPPFFPPDQVTDSYERDIAADLIRESALVLLRDEVPHGIAIRMDEYTERGDIGAYIEATIFVERESQKGIVIGENGNMIKLISTRAREEIEKMSGRKVFIRLRVKVRKNWRNDDRALQLFGFKGKG